MTVLSTVFSEVFKFTNNPSRGATRRPTLRRKCFLRSQYFSYSRQIPCFLCNPEIYYCVTIGRHRSLLSSRGIQPTHSHPVSLRTKVIFFISGFHLAVDENCALRGRYAASRGNFLPTFRDNLSVPSSGVKNPLKVGPIGCPETSVISYHYSQRNSKEELSSHCNIFPH
jgi:hypothetical protein